MTEGRGRQDSCLNLLIALHPGDPGDIAALLPAGPASALVYVGDDAGLLVSSVRALRPAVLLASVSALGDPGPGTVRQLAAAPARPDIYLFQPGPGEIRPAGLLEAGCRAVLAAAPPDVLAIVAALTARGGDLPRPDPPAHPGDVPAPGARTRLTTRETAVLQGMARGATNAGIAHELGLSMETVKTHSRRIYRHLGARDRAHAVAIAMRQGLLTSQPPP